jgi:hypothetical protein
LAKDDIRASPRTKQISFRFAGFWLGAIFLMFLGATISEVKSGGLQKIFVGLALFSPLFAAGLWLNWPYLLWWRHRLKTGAPRMRIPQPLVSGTRVQFSFIDFPRRELTQQYLLCLVAHEYSSTDVDSGNWNERYRSDPAKLSFHPDSSASADIYLSPTAHGDRRWSVEVSSSADAFAKNDAVWSFKLPRAVCRSL